MLDQLRVPLHDKPFDLRQAAWRVSSAITRRLGCRRYARDRLQLDSRSRATSATQITTWWPLKASARAMV